ncbi:hypothetical protein [Candidatus Phytoplasma solani]|uniref:hypothetical protein n=1 Tax=Candidatus Phytoplasma solani TaxID=69896 RepID=UPI00358E6B19
MKKNRIGTGTIIAITVTFILILVGLVFFSIRNKLKLKPWMHSAAELKNAGHTG